jgi:hypothetical protein
MRDILECLMQDPGARTFGQLAQERALVAQEIQHLTT